MKKILMALAFVFIVGLVVWSQNTYQFGQVSVGGLPANRVRNTYIQADGTAANATSSGDIATTTGSSAAQTGLATAGVGIGYFAGAINTVSGVSGNVNYRTGRNINLFFIGGAAGKITDERWWFGVTDQTLATFGGSDNPAGNYAGFRFSTQVPDASWQAITKDGTTQTIISTGVAPVINTAQTFLIVFNDAVPNVQFYINGTLVATSTTHLPTTATYLRYAFTNECFASTTSNGFIFETAFISVNF